MKTSIKLFLLIILISLSPKTYSQPEWSGKAKELIETIEKFSETTSPSGQGADAYSEFLHIDFSRWTMGSSLENDKENWVEGVREWFDDGWRVSERHQETIEMLIEKKYAHVRRIVTETYKGPKGDTSKSKAALAEIWIKHRGKWMLFRVNVQPLSLD